MEVSKATILISLLLAASVCFADEIFKCKHDGKIVFTDNASNCGSEVTITHLDVKKSSRVNYRYPERRYNDKSSSYSIYIEFPETEKDKIQLNQGVTRLGVTLDLIFSKIPRDSHAYLKKTNFYIMIGPRSHLGGEKSGLRYYPKNGDTTLLLGDKRWVHSVVIYNVENFLWLSDQWVHKTIMHELSHAWHYQDWAKNYPILKKTWLSSRRKSLYLSQRDIKGRILKPAYASTNEKEYFSELSAIYFVGGVYYPFSKDELKVYDSDGFNMVKQVWGL